MRLFGGVCAVPQVDRERRSRLRLEEDRLVDRSALVAGEDVLQSDERRVLPGDREGVRLHALRLQVGDDRRRVLVVRDERAFDARVGGERLLELGLRCRRRPRSGRVATSSTSRS